MDVVYEQSKVSGDTIRPPLVPSYRSNNYGVSGTSRATRDVSSRYMSPTPRRYPSPIISRPHSTTPAPKRSQSAERKPRSPSPSPSLSPRSPSGETQVMSRKINMGRASESSLWPSTMRSLSVSFQSDSISIPVCRRERPAVPSKPSSNVKVMETLAVPRKAIPERKRSPLKGKNVSNLLDNSKLSDGFIPKSVDHRRWPSRIGGGNALTRSVDLSRTSPLPSPGSRNSSERLNLLVPTNPIEKTMSLPSLESRSPSPIKERHYKALISPSKTRPSTSSFYRGVSPSRIRMSSPSRQPAITTSVLSFAADIRKSKKSEHQIEDAHQLKLLYNCFLQWQFANCKGKYVFSVQKFVAERTFLNVWGSLQKIRDSVREKRIAIQWLKLKMKLDQVLNKQMGYLDDWGLIEKVHWNSLCGVIEDLRASTLRLPLTTGTKADIKTLKMAVFSAVDVMHSIVESINSFMSRVEVTSIVASELSDIAAHGRSLLHQCETLLASTAELQVVDYSLMTNLIQLME